MDITKISTGKNAPQEVNAFIEIPEGSFVKYELDKESGVVMVDRFLYTNMPYPFSYGFIPNTLAADGDPTDVLVLSSQSLAVGTVCPVRVIGMLEMEDEAGVDTKILVVPTAKIDPFSAHINDVTDIPEPTKNKIKHFFEHYKDLEPNKWVKAKAFLPKEKAFDDIKQSMK